MMRFLFCSEFLQAIVTAVRIRAGDEVLAINPIMSVVALMSGVVWAAAHVRLLVLYLR